MRYKEELLGDNYSFEQAEIIQTEYQNKIKSLRKKDIEDIKSIRTVVGVDISYFRVNDKENGVACAVLWNLEQNKKEDHYFAQDLINFPYRPGFLGFRECKLLFKVISKLPNKPDLIMCDGHGKIHPRRFGEAVHLGIVLNVPTIGVAKNPFIGFFNKNEIQKIKGYKEPVLARNPEYTDNISPNELLGYAICLNDHSKPVFISVGYRITIDVALETCLITAIGHRQPEPLYLADHLSKEMVKRLIS